MMRILLHHPVKLPVTHYGGTERVLIWLAKSLAKMGHTVGIVAAQGSRTPDGIECIPNPEIYLQEPKKVAENWDVLHCFSTPNAQMKDLFQGRVLMTVEGNGQVGERFDRNTVFVSKNHAERHGATAFVYNGLDPDELQFDDRPRPNRYLFLSKTSWSVKNLSLAVSLCRQFKQNLWIAGGEGPLHLKAYTKLMSVLGRGHQWVGSVDQQQKADFLISGRAMMFPIKWHEPFGIVMVEALVSGTPVLAHPFGSVPEVLGFAPQCLMRSTDDWRCALMGEVILPRPKECRDWAIANFDQVQMARKYVELYERVIRGELLNESAPVTKVGALDLLK